MLEEKPRPPIAVDFQAWQAQVRNKSTKPDAQGHGFAQRILPLQKDRPPGGSVLEEAPPPQG